MQSIAELGRRLAVVWLWFVVSVQCLTRSLRAAPPARPAPLPGSLLRRDYAAAGHLAGRLIFVRVQLVVLPIGGAA